MTVLAGFVYVIYFMLLGSGVRIAVNRFTKTKFAVGHLSDFIAHSFFQGVFFHLVMFNILQCFNWPVTILISTVSLAIFLAVYSLVLQVKQGIEFAVRKSSTQRTGLLTFILLLASLFIYWNGHILPNIAWDSWVVWEGKANQWQIHGLDTEIVGLEAWLNNSSTLFNPAANYPDGLSLVFYLPKLLINNGFAVTQIVTLFAFAMMSLLLVNRLAKHGASIYLQVFMLLVIYTIPLMSNHLMIQGYADIWLAMYILLIMLTLIDYLETGYQDVGMTLLCYLAILPMLKLEGWVWLMLIALSYLLRLGWRSHRLYWMLGSLTVLALIFISGIINFSLPFGDLIVNSQQVVVFDLINTPIQFINISEQLMTSLFWQNNWSLIWLGLPFLMMSFFTQTHNQANQTAQIFFISALLCFLFLFYFTEASQWAVDFTAINRLVLQLTPCYLYLLFNMLSKVETYQPIKKPAQDL